MRDGTYEVIAENSLRLGQNVKYVTDVLKLTTRADIAAALNVTSQSVSQLIVGSTKGLKPINLVKIARFFGISVEDLVTEDLTLRSDLVGSMRRHFSGAHAHLMAENGSPAYAPRERLDALVRNLYIRFNSGQLDLDVIGLLEHVLRLNKPMN